jgi:hypothetical protein
MSLATVPIIPMPAPPSTPGAMSDPITGRERRRWHPADAMFTNTAGRPVHAESISQLFDRHLAPTGLPRIRFHDLRVRHEAPCIRAG